MLTDVSATSNQADHPPQSRPPLVVTCEEEFERLMEEVDRELVKGGVPIPARQLKAGLIITRRYDIVLPVGPADAPILPGVFTPEQVSRRVNAWMQRRYGERLKLDFSMGRVVVPLRGTLYAVRCPMVLGTVQFVCESATFGQRRETLGVKQPPTCNMLDLVEGFTSDMARSLTGVEVVQIGAIVVSGMGTFLAMQTVNDVQFVGEALGDLEAAVVHLMEHKPQVGLSKWASLQAVEKLLKAFIVSKGGTIQHHHRLKDHVADAVKLGLPPPPPEYVRDVQCPAGVRYGEVAVSVDEAVTAHLVSLEMCEVAARSVAAALKRPASKSPQPFVDGVPLNQFLQKHAKPCTPRPKSQGSSGQ